MEIDAIGELLSAMMWRPLLHYLRLLHRTFLDSWQCCYIQIVCVMANTIAMTAKNFIRFMMKEAMFLLVIIILVNPEESMADSRAQTIQFTCTQELDQNTTTFIRNFVASMENISDQIRTLGFGVAISEEGPSANYALAQCYGDLTPVDCVSCYTKARTTLPQCFPFTGGRIFLDGCFMRSENYSFFQEFTGPQDTAMCGNKTKMDPGFEGLATRAVLQAAADAPSNNGSSRAEFPASGSGRKNDSAYVLAECWRLLNSNSCKVCLQNAAKSLLGCLPWSEGRALHTGCFMRYSATNFLNPKPLTGLSIASRFPMAKPGCINTCGNNVMIPYPFGVGADCALNESYTIRCRRKSTNVFRDDLQTPFVRVKGNEYEVLEVSLRDQTVTIIDPLSNSSCNVANASGFGLYDSFNLDGTPFFYSKEHNQLKLLGCGNAYLYQHLVLGRSEALSECKSACSSENTDGCQTDIPFNLNQYTVNFIKAKTSLPRCTSAILADKQWKPQKNSYPPVVWSWTLQNPHEADGVRGCSLKSRSLEIESGNVIISYGCECSAFGSLTWGYEINPYLNGSCDHASSVLNGMPKDTKKVAIISGTTGFGTFLLMVAFFASYKIIKKWHIKKRKEKFFKRNGGLLLQQQLSSDEGVVDKTMIFSATELNKASDGFNPNRVLGEGGQGTVYKGMLTDGRIVAIKKSNQVGERELEQFINEVVILSQVNHRNVVKVLGCCLETEVPLLVYEFIPNGTLYNLIHNKHDQEFPLTWSMRLRIAMEVASALAYLHSSISMPIFHKDIKSSNILLDEKYTAKVADFGTSRSVAIDKTHLTTRVQGTFGYIDPEYFQSGKFTDKSDVYSFGVVLIELLTRQKPTSAGKGEDSDIGLAGRFLKCMEKAAILDPEIMDDTNEEDEIIQVAKLAKRCIRLNGRRRPTMKEVAMELESIKLSFMLHSPTMESSSPRYQIYLQQELGVHTWTYGSEFTVPSASQSIPLLFDTV